MPDEDIQRLRATRTIQTRFTIRAPIDGAITAFDLRTGMNISKDKVVAQIQGMDPVWIGAAVPESIAYLLKETSQFAVSIPAYRINPSRLKNGVFCRAWIQPPVRCRCACRSLTGMSC